MNISSKQLKKVKHAGNVLSLKDIHTFEQCIFDIYRIPAILPIIAFFLDSGTLYNEVFLKNSFNRIIVRKVMMSYYHQREMLLLTKKGERLLNLIRVFSNRVMF